VLLLGWYELVLVLVLVVEAEAALRLAQGT
jgi:hypothetical protein